MTVTVIDRGKGREYSFALRTVTIADTCPACHSLRGKPYPVTQCEDGEWYTVHRWDNPCGHVDLYRDVIDEADRHRPLT